MHLYKILNIINQVHKQVRQFNKIFFIQSAHFFFFSEILHFLSSEQYFIFISVAAPKLRYGYCPNVLLSKEIALAIVNYCYCLCLQSISKYISVASKDLHSIDLHWHKTYTHNTYTNIRPKLIRPTLIRPNDIILKIY